MKNIGIFICIFFLFLESNYGQNNCITLYEDKKYNKAIRCLPAWELSTLAQKEIRIQSFMGLQNPDSSLVWVNRFFKEGDHSEPAISKEVYLNGFRSYFIKADYKNAIEFYHNNSEAVRFPMDSIFNYKSNYNIGKAFFETGDYYSALQFYQISHGYTQKNSYENYYSKLAIANTLYANYYDSEALDTVEYILKNKAFKEYLDKYFYLI